MGCDQSKPQPPAKAPQPVAPPARPNLPPQRLNQQPQRPQGPAPDLAPGGASRKFCVPSSKHHLIIGKEGETVKRLSAAHNIQIVVSPPDRPSNVVVIEGAPAAIDATVKELEDILHFDFPEGSLSVYSLEIPGHKVGVVIGKGGMTLRDIERTCRCTVTIPPRDKPGPITLEGTAKACEAGLQKIKATIGEEHVQRVVKGVDDTAAAAPPSAGNLPRINLGKRVSRVLFFPEKLEPEGAYTMQVFLQYLGSAEQTLDICVFTMTNDEIANCILNSHRRGVKVRILTDNDQARSLGSDIEKFVRAGIPCTVDDKPEHMHHKFAVLDNRVLINGSFNWTAQAQSGNDENVMITSEPAFIQAYNAEFENLWRKYHH
ncbi:Mitochondrial cardiolipin hydrolase [Diplonema papillatum]|nr:Mitochondrial cardiolipin hydrolase [Diplonema papillatum]